MKTSSRTDVYQIITDLIIEKLEMALYHGKSPGMNMAQHVNYLSKSHIKASTNSS
jgi:antirestriction protein ArdC